jgi:outer membrane protein assembly factor BamB
MRFLRGAAVGLVVTGSVSLLVAELSPGAAAPQPPALVAATWLVHVVVAWILAQVATARDSRLSSGLLAVLVVVPAWWSVLHAEDTLAGALLPIGFLGALLGAAILVVTDPVVRPRPAGIAAGAVALGCVAAPFVWSTEPPSVEAPAAEPTTRQATEPARPTYGDEVSWVWKPPDGQDPQDLVVAGQNVVARTDGGVVALEARNGKERWRYGSRGARSSYLAATPNETHVAVGFDSRLLVLDAKTGEVRFDRNLPPLGKPNLAVTDRAVVNSEAAPNRGATLRAYDLRTGEYAWSYTTPPGCEWDRQDDAPKPTRNAFLLSLVCTPERSARPGSAALVLLALDDRTGKQRWRFARDLPATVGDGKRIQDELHVSANAGTAWIGAHYPHPTQRDQRGLSYVVNTATGRLLGEFGPGIQVVAGLNQHGLLSVDMTGNHHLVSLDGGALIGSIDRSELPPVERVVRATETHLIDLECDGDQVDSRAQLKMLPWEASDKRKQIVLSMLSASCEGYELAPGAVVVWGPGEIVGLRPPA